MGCCCNIATDNVRRSHPWQKLRPVISFKLTSMLTQFYETHNKDEARVITTTDARHTMCLYSHEACTRNARRAHS